MTGSTGPGRVAAGPVSWPAAGRSACRALLCRSGRRRPPERSSRRGPPGRSSQRRLVGRSTRREPSARSSRDGPAGVPERSSRRKPPACSSRCTAPVRSSRRRPPGRSLGAEMGGRWKPSRVFARCRPPRTPPQSASGQKVRLGVQRATRTCVTATHGPDMGVRTGRTMDNQALRRVIAVLRRLEAPLDQHLDRVGGAVDEEVELLALAGEKSRARSRPGPCGPAGGRCRSAPAGSPACRATR